MPLPNTTVYLFMQKNAKVPVIMILKGVRDLVRMTVRCSSDDDKWKTAES